MKRLVILRPEPGASVSVAKASNLGIEAIAIPLFEVQPTAWTFPDHGRWDGIVVTSANAIRHAGPELGKVASVPVYAVGEATAAAARAAGLTVALVGNGGVDALAPRLPGGRLLHLCGEHFHPIPGATAIPVYRSVAIDPPPSLQPVEGAIVAVHSPRAGRRLAELVGQRRSITLVAISDAAAQSAGTGWAQVAIAECPSDDALLALAKRLCQEERR